MITIFSNTLYWFTRIIRKRYMVPPWTSVLAVPLTVRQTQCQHASGADPASTERGYYSVQYADRILICCPLSFFWVANGILFETHPSGQRISETSRYIKCTGSSGFVFSGKSLGCSQYRAFIHSFSLFFCLSLHLLLLFFSCLARMRLYQILIFSLPLIGLTVGAAAEQDLPQCAVRSHSWSIWNPLPHF